MNKPDRRGYMRSYAGVMLFFVVILAIQAHDFFDAFMSGGVPLWQWIFLVFWIVAIIYVLLRGKKEFIMRHEKWLKIEQARMDVNKSTLYHTQPQPVLISLSELALKKRPKAADVFLKVCMVCLGLCILSIVALIISNVYAHQPVNSTIVNIEVGIICFSAIFLLLAGMVAIPAWLNGSSTIVASADGLQLRRGLLKKNVRWQHASLFALGEYPTGTSQWIELSSSTTILRWFNENGPIRGEYLYFIRATPGSESGYRRVNREEYRAASDYLNSHIAQRTGLPLRDVRCIT